MKIKEWVDSNDPGFLVIVLFIVFVFRLVKIKEWVDANDPGALVIVLFIVSVFRLVKIKEWVDANDPGALVIPFSCALEQQLADLAANEEKEIGTTRSVGGG